MNTLISTAYLLLFVLSSSYCDYPLTTKEVPLYIRQSWINVTEPHRTPCICETKVKPTSAYKSMMFTEIPNDPCLKCYYKCLSIKLNLMEATTGNFVEKEFLRQIEGVTPEIFKRCNEKLKCEVDLCKKCFGMYLCIVHSVLVPKSHPPIDKYH
ncbi:hypothetical protein RN001_009953 [Aquatica leii]|uniref:Uncharacterized protein n=1 Tax=Aquatica leii TaxID=1421715 RepID=A0AAN7PVW3_9COLE|nr:hypothetical protein RN001_009953 [Aquatica leii]